MGPLRATAWTPRERASCVLGDRVRARMWSCHLQVSQLLCRRRLAEASRATPRVSGLARAMGTTGFREVRSERRESLGRRCGYARCRGRNRRSGREIQRRGCFLVADPHGPGCQHERRQIWDRSCIQADVEKLLCAGRLRGDGHSISHDLSSLVHATWRKFAHRRALRRDAMQLV